jgi:hypothetical protein
VNDQEYLESAGIKDSPETPTTETPQAEAASPTPPAEMFELGGNKFPITSEFSFIDGGKPVKKTYNELVNTWRQANHLQNKYTEQKKLLDAQQDYQRLKEFHGKYGALQEWSEKNPQDWERLYSLWQNKDQHLLSSQLQPGQQTPNNPNLNPLVEKIAQLEQALNSKVMPFLTDFETKQKEEMEAKDVESVKGEIHEFGKKFPEINLAEVDPDGVPVWAKIVQWGSQNGYSDFTPAARMYLSDRIDDVLLARGRTEATKTVKQDHANGIIKRSATPITGQGQTAPQLNKLSYGEIAELAKSGQFAMGS